VVMSGLDGSALNASLPGTRMGRLVSTHVLRPTPRLQRVTSYVSHTTHCNQKDSTFILHGMSNMPYS
jgi:hypothetical protein